MTTLESQVRKDEQVAKRELFLAMPKTDLHCHLDGSLRLKTMLELAETQEVDLPGQNIEELACGLRIGERSEDLNMYLKAFGATCSVLQTEIALDRAAYELVEDAKADGVWHLEVRYSPILHQERGLSLFAIIEAVLSGLNRGAREFGMSFGLIVCGIRNAKPSESLKLAHAAIAYRNRGVVAFDLAGGEHGFPAADHQESFRRVREHTMFTTIHAGEAYGPESIRQALFDCHADRIGHGTRLFEDPDLLNYMNDRRIPLEVCLSSNLQTNTVQDLSHHPAKQYFDLGLRISLSTDNRLISDTTLTREFEIAHGQVGFSVEELKVVAMQGFKSAFLPYQERKSMMARANETMLKLTGSYPAGTPRSSRELG